jgi:peptide/nickel transport system substrate-binding protein
MLKPLVLIVGLAILGVVLAACGDDATPTSPPATATTAPTATPVPATATPVPPTSTPRPTATSRPGETPPPATFTPTPRPQPTATPTATPAPTPIVRPGKQGGHPIAATIADIFHWGVHECAAFDNTCLAHPAPNYNQLIEYNADTDDITDIRCDLCTDWDLADDGVTYTFTLHPDATWNNGQPVTAKDVVFSLDRMVDPDRPHPKTRAIGPFYDSSRVIDEKTVEVKTKFPAPPFFAFLASEYMKILSKDHVESVPDQNMQAFEHIMGSGPFKVVEAEDAVKIEYVKNEDYFKQGLPYWDAVTMFIIIEKGSLFAAYRTQQVMFTNHANSLVTARDMRELLNDHSDKIRFVIQGPTSTLGVEFQTETAPFDNPKVRHALYIAMHRREFVDFIGPGTDLVGGPWPPNAWYGISEDELKAIPGFRETPDGKKHPDDIALAKSMLAEEGIGEGFEIELIFPVFSSHPDMQAIYQDQMNTFLGWNMGVRGVEIQAFLEAWNKRQFEIITWGYGIQAHDPHDALSGFYTKGASSLHSDWSHPRIEEIFQLQAKELDQATRAALIREAAEIFVTEDAPIMVTHYGARPHYSSLQLQNHHNIGTFSDYLKMENWWCDPAC